MNKERITVYNWGMVERKRFRKTGKTAEHGCIKFTRPKRCPKGESLQREETLRTPVREIQKKNVSFWGQKT